MKNKIVQLIKKINDKHKAWVKGRGYKYSKPLIISFFVVSFLLLGVVAYLDGVKPKLYVSCPLGGTPCENPLKELSDCEEWFCELDFLAPGQSYGEATSWLGRNYSLLVSLLFILVLLVNHIVFNKGYDFNKYWGDFK